VQDRNPLQAATVHTAKPAPSTDGLEEDPAE